MVMYIFPNGIYVESGKNLSLNTLRKNSGFYFIYNGVEDVLVIKSYNNISFQIYGTSKYVARLSITKCVHVLLTRKHGYVKRFHTTNGLRF